MFKFKNFKILLLLMLFAFAGKDAWAGGQTYHHWYRFQAEVKTQPTGVAKVYGAFPESNGSISFKENVFTCHKHFDKRTDEPVAGTSTGDYDAYLKYDNVVNGYRFLHWVDSKGNIITSFDEAQQAYTATVTSDNLCFTEEYGTTYKKNDDGTIDYTTTYNKGVKRHLDADDAHPYYTNEIFTAVFEKLTTDPVVMVSTEGAEDEQVSAKVSPEENAVGDEVTISTQVNSDASLQAWKNKFLGWKFNGEFIRDSQGNIIRDVSYTFTITEDNKGEYVAVYEGDYSFFRIKCLGSPHRYASAIKDGINYLSLDLSDNINLSDNPTSYLPDAGTVLQFDYKKKPSGYSGHYHEVYVQNIAASNGYDFASGSYVRMTYIPQSNTYLFSTKATGGTRFRDDNGTPTISALEDDYGYWYIEPMDKDLETCENYFSLDPAKLVKVGDDYYTTLRTSWNILFDPEQMTPYYVSSYDETARTFEMEELQTSNNIIPAGTPVIIKTKSNDIEENRMVPTMKAFQGTKPNSETNKLQCSEKYFPNQTVSTSSNYKKLMVNTNGELAFGGSALNSVNGNEAYLSVENEVVKIETLPLSEIEQVGVKDRKYIVKDQLVVIYADVDKGMLWCKDQGNQSIAMTKKQDGQIDYMREITKEQKKEWDQSNWVVLQFDQPTPNSDLENLLKTATGKYIEPATIKGTYSDVNNYTITMANQTLQLNDGGEPYVKNLYCTANFLPKNLNINGGAGAEGIYHGEPAHYFFMNPKVQEVCEITYAEWDGDNLFIVPLPSENNLTQNDSQIDGAFTVAWTYNCTNQAPSLSVGTPYRFLAVVHRTDDSSYLKGVELEPSSDFIIYPLNLDPENNNNVITAIDGVQSGKTITRVVYYNLMGVASDKPHHGINIVETRYSDGSRSTVKVVK